MPKHPEQSPGTDPDDIQPSTGPNAAPQPEQADASAPGAQPSEPDAKGKAGELQARIDILETEKAELSDRFLRKAAEFENYRKRTIKEKEEARLYANTELLVELIGLLDDFDRAIQSAEVGQDFKALHEGVSMIQKAFLNKLEGRYGLKRFESAGEPFDPARHEAVMAESRPDIDEAVVIEDFMKGYALHDRIIRPAKVKVAMPLKQDGPPPGEEPRA